MAVRIPVSRALLDWAIDRSGRGREEILDRFPRLDAWKAGDVQPTLKQLEQFARATYTPVGYLFLTQPPYEELPVADFRRVSGRPVKRPSAALLETVYLCEQRQEWYHDFARSSGHENVAFVGSLDARTDPVTAGAEMRRVLDFEVADRRHYSTWSEALSGLITSAEEAGVLVMTSGIVGNNTHRLLDPSEFRGFALVDPLAPVVFINGADSKAGQIFTLAHELAHVWLGQSGVSNPGLDQRPEDATELWCNAVAAELLVPMTAFRNEFDTYADMTAEVQRLARVFKVSAPVVLRRALEAGLLSWDAYLSALRRETGAARDRRASGGGSFYATQPVRVSKTFMRAVLVDTLEGRTLRRDAFRLLGFRKASTFDELVDRLGLTV